MSVAVRLCCLQAVLELWLPHLERDGKEGWMKSGWDEKRHPRGNSAAGQTVFADGPQSKKLLASTARAKQVQMVACSKQRGGAGTQQVAPKHQHKGWESQPAQKDGICLGRTAQTAHIAQGRSKVLSRHQPEVYLNVWLSAPPRPNPGKETAGSASLLWDGEGTEGCTCPRDRSPEPSPPTSPATETLPLGPNKAA